MQQHSSKYFSCRPHPFPLTFGMGSIGQNLTFSEHGHVAYQINGITKCSNTVANIMPADPLPLDLWDGVNRSKFDFFQNMVMLISN